MHLLISFPLLSYNFYLFNMARTRKVNRGNPAETPPPLFPPSVSHAPLNSLLFLPPGEPSVYQHSTTSDSTSGSQSSFAKSLYKRREPSLAFPDYTQEQGFMDLSNTGFTHSIKTPWFSEETRYAMGNGEAWVDLLCSSSPGDLNSHKKTRESRMLSTSNTKMRELQNLKQNPKAKRPKLKETETGAGLVPRIPETAQRRRGPRAKRTDPRDLVKCRSSDQEPSLVFQLPQVLDQSLISRLFNPRTPAKNLKLSEHDKDPFYPKHHETNAKPYAKLSHEVAKQIEDTYMWSGPIEGNGTQTRKKFGMCGLSWMCTLDFLKAPTVGGKPTITVTRITPGGSTSKVIIDDLMLQFSVPEADFLGNYRGGTMGVLGELGIQPVTYKPDSGDHLGPLLIDRTCLNGIFLCGYRGENLEDENRVLYDSAKQYMHLDSSSTWKWFLETFFTSETSPGRKESQMPSGSKDNTSPNVQPPHSVEPSIPVVEVGSREQAHTVGFSGRHCSDLLGSVLPRYIPRVGLPPGTGSLLIVVPLNESRAMCEMNRLDEIREKRITNSSNSSPRDQRRGKWLLLDAPIANMKWIQSAARNIYKVRPTTQQSFGDERITQSVAIDFSRRLWLDICEGMQFGWGKFPETEDVRTARVMKNRHGGRSRKERQLSGTEKVLNNEHHKYSIMELTIENELREHGYRGRSEWDKLATGWVAEKLLDEPAIAKLVEAKRKRMAMENEWEEREIRGDNVQARTDIGDEEETYLVISGCTLAKESSYNKFASSLASEQHITLSSSNRLNPSYPGSICGQQRANEAVVNISCEEPIPPEVIHDKHWMFTQRNNSLPTPWKDHGGVRDLLENDHSLEDTCQTYVVVLALVPSLERKHWYEERPPTQVQADSQTSICKRQSENQRPLDRGLDSFGQGVPEKSAVGGGGDSGERTDPGQYGIGLPNQHFEFGGALTSQMQLKSKLTDVPHTLTSLLGSSEYKVIAIYPQKRCCAYCGCVINTKTNHDIVRCGKSGRSSPNASSKGTDFVHHTDEQALQEGCCCNEAKNFHKANGCLSHCQYCNEKCKDKHCEQEKEMELIWARMVEHFRLMHGLEVSGRPEDSSMVVNNTQHELNSITRWYRQTYSPTKKDTSNMCLNWPGGWTERGVLTRKREAEERMAEIEREHKRSKKIGVEVGTPLKRIEYQTPGWKGTIKEGWQLPWSRGSWGTESVWAGTVGGMNGVRERLWGAQHV